MNKDKSCEEQDNVAGAADFRQLLWLLPQTYSLKLPVWAYTVFQGPNPNPTISIISPLNLTSLQEEAVPTRNLGLQRGGVATDREGQGSLRK